MNSSSNPTMALDRSAALDRVGGDEELLREIASLFLSEYPVLVQEIRDAVERRDALALERSAHSLKGSVANFEAHAAVSASFRLEAIGRSKDLDQVATALAELDAAFRALEPALVDLTT